MTIGYNVNTLELKLMLNQFEKICESAAQTHIEYVKAKNATSLQGIKGLMYLNGVATITVMTFLGHYNISSIPTYIYFAISILCFAFGTLLGVLTYFQESASQSAISRLYEIVHRNYQSLDNLEKNNSEERKTIHQKFSEELDQNDSERKTTNSRVLISKFLSVLLFCFGLGGTLTGIGYTLIKYYSTWYSICILFTPAILLLVFIMVVEKLVKKKSKLTSS